MKTIIKKTKNSLKLQKLLLTTAVLFTFYTTTVNAAANIEVRWEEQNGLNFGVINKAIIDASNTLHPQLVGFSNIFGDLWNVDISGNVITVTYTSIYQGFEYMYDTGNFIGFHFTDSQNILPDFTKVTPDISFAPFGLDSRLIRFDANNIWIDLQGSMCHAAGMGSMPACVNAQSPTGRNNFIKLTVEVAATEISNARIDALFDWAERTYPELFTSHQNSVPIIGYYARGYANNVYLGTKDGRVWLYMDNNLTDVGGLSEWLAKLNL